MLGVCLGNKNTKADLRCDQSKKNLLLRRLNPLSINVEKLISFSADGGMYSINNDLFITQDIELLNLNEYFLKKNRQVIINDLQQKYMVMKRKCSLSDKNLFFRKQLAFWKNERKGMLQVYNQVAIAWLEKRQKK